MNEYRHIPKVGYRRKQWLIVNQFGGLLVEVIGNEQTAINTIKGMYKAELDNLKDVRTYSMKRAWQLKLLGNKSYTLFVQAARIRHKQILEIIRYARTNGYYP